MRLRSPILARMPSTRIRISESAGRISLRLLIGLPILFSLFVLILIIYFQLLPHESVPGRLLYGFHDWIFLPFKGNFYTRFFPESLVWWGIILTMILLIVISLLSDRSLIKGPHIWLLRGCMARPTLHGYVIQGTRFLQRIGLQPHLIRAVAWREWEAAIITLSNQGFQEGTAKQCRQVRALTLFYMQIDRFFSSDDLSHLRNLETWHKAYLTVLVYGNSRELGQLNDAFLEFDFSLFGDFDPLNLTSDQLFKPVVLLRDVKVLYELGRGHAAADAAQDGQVASAFLTYREILIDIIERRRREVFDAATFKLERGLALSLSDDSLTTLYQPLELSDSLQELPILGRIALNVVLHTAYITKKTDIGLAYVESLEALDFMLASTTAHSPAIGKLRALTQEPLDLEEGTWRYVPLSEAYRLLSRLVINGIDFQEDQWEPLFDQLDPPVERIVFQNMRELAAAYYQAAGPATDDDTDLFDLFSNQ